jgi:hypothetical protein
VPKVRAGRHRIKPIGGNGDRSGTSVTPVSESWKTVRFAILAAVVAATMCVTGQAEDAVMTGSFLLPLLR